MGTFGKLLDKYIELRKSERYWLDKSDFHAVRALWLALGSFLSILVGIGLGSAGISIIFTLVITLACASIFLPACFLFSSFHWKRRQRNFALSDDNFNYRKYLEDKFEVEVRKIKLLPIKDDKKDILILKEYKRHQETIAKIDRQIESHKIEHQSFETSETIGKFITAIENKPIYEIIIDKNKRSLLSQVNDSVPKIREDKSVPDIKDSVGKSNTQIKVNSMLLKGTQIRKDLQDFIKEIKENKQIASNKIITFIQEKGLTESFSEFIEENSKKEFLQIDELIDFSNTLEKTRLIDKGNLDWFVDEVHVIKAMTTSYII